MADFIETLTPAERERFADLLDECRQRESTIRANATRAETALRRLEADGEEFWRKVRDLRRLSDRLRESVYRLYLVTAPSHGQVS